MGQKERGECVCMWMWVHECVNSEAGEMGVKVEVVQMTVSGH